MAGLNLEGIGVWLGGQQILKDVDLSVVDGECVALLGPSGCGKTTTLRAIAGFIQPQEGDLRIGGQSMRGVPPNRRNVGLVFQDYALFPHMTIGENVAYGLQMRRVPAAEVTQRVHAALEMVQLDHVKARFPANLSGGQRQRVALARALVIRPDILLLDEPLGALDRKLRDRMQVELKLLQRRLGITTIIVTHDQEEALSLADRVAVMFEGRIVEIGHPTQLYEKPGSRQVMEFLGSSNLLRAKVTASDAAGCLVVGSAGLNLRIAGCERRTGEDVTLAIRPEHVRIAAPDDAGTDVLKAQVVECVYKGSVTEVHTRLADGTAFMVNAAAADVARLGLDRHGASVALRMAAERVQVFAT